MSDSLFSFLDRNHDNELSKSEVLVYAKEVLGLKSEEAAKRVGGFFFFFFGKPIRILM